MPIIRSCGHREKWQLTEVSISNQELDRDRVSQIAEAIVPNPLSIYV
jgi:hypothetical protein